MSPRCPTFVLVIELCASLLWYLHINVPQRYTDKRSQTHAIMAQKIHEAIQIQIFVHSSVCLSTFTLLTLSATEFRCIFACTFENLWLSSLRLWEIGLVNCTADRLDKQSVATNMITRLMNNEWANKYHKMLFNNVVCWKKVCVCALKKQKWTSADTKRGAELILEKFEVVCEDFD